MCTGINGIGYFLREVSFLVTDWDTWVIIQDDIRWYRRKYGNARSMDVTTPQREAAGYVDQT